MSALIWQKKINDMIRLNVLFSRHFQKQSEEEKRKKFLEDSDDSNPDDPDPVSDPDQASFSDFSEEEAAKK